MKAATTQRIPWARSHWLMAIAAAVILALAGCSDDVPADPASMAPGSVGADTGQESSHACPGCAGSARSSGSNLPIRPQDGK